MTLGPSPGDEPAVVESARVAGEGWLVTAPEGVVTISVRQAGIIRKHTVRILAPVEGGDIK